MINDLNACIVAICFETSKAVNRQIRLAAKSEAGCSTICIKYKCKSTVDTFWFYKQQYYYYIEVLIEAISGPIQGES